MTTIYDWISSSDANYIDADINGQGRGDGWNVRTYKSESTGRYIVRAEKINVRKDYWFVANSKSGADAVGAHGYTPGGCAGNYRCVRNPDRLMEVRMLANVSV
jgi:hypothetical protein